MVDGTRALSCASNKPTGNLSLSFPRVTWETSSTYRSVICKLVNQSCGWLKLLIDLRPPSTFITSRKSYRRIQQNGPRQKVQGCQDLRVYQLQVAARCQERKGDLA